MAQCRRRVAALELVVVAVLVAVAMACGVAVGQTHVSQITGMSVVDLPNVIRMNGVGFFITDDTPAAAMLVSFLPDMDVSTSFQTETAAISYDPIDGNWAFELNWNEAGGNTIGVATTFGWLNNEADGPHAVYEVDVMTQVTCTGCQGDTLVERNIYLQSAPLQWALSTSADGTTQTLALKMTSAYGLQFSWPTTDSNGNPVSLLQAPIFVTSPPILGLVWDYQQASSLSHTVRVQGLSATSSVPPIGTAPAWANSAPISNVSVDSTGTINVAINSTGLTNMAYMTTMLSSINGQSINSPFSAMSPWVGGNYAVSTFSLPNTNIATTHASVYYGAQAASNVANGQLAINLFVQVLQPISNTQQNFTFPYFNGLTVVSWTDTSAGNYVFAIIPDGNLPYGALITSPTNANNPQPIGSMSVSPSSYNRAQLTVVPGSSPREQSYIYVQLERVSYLQSLVPSGASTAHFAGI